MENLLDKLREVQDSLTIKQRMLCKYIIQNCKTVYLMPIGDLSEKSNVGRATIMRFLDVLGYRSYTEFKRALNHACNIEFEADKISNPFFWSKTRNKSLDSLTDCLDESIQLLQKTAAEVDSERFGHIVDLIISAKRVNVLGLRSSSPIAKYTVYQLQNFVDAYDLSDNESMIYDRLYRRQTGDILLLITLQPTTTTSVRVAELCSQWNIPVIVITDDRNASVLKYATDHICVARSDSSRLSILPHMLILEAIINELGVRMAPLSVHTLDQLNQFLLEQNVISN